jgi:uncharacterized protein (DUF736 family)
MAYEHKPNSGSAFANKKKTTDNHPDFTGTAMIDGKMMDISIWMKTSAQGTEYFSLSFRTKTANHAPDMP